MAASQVKESNVDVLVIGAGPAGLTCALGLAQAGIHVRIIDKRPVKITAGQAGSVNSRTIEVMQSYGLADRLIREGNRLYLSSYYKPGPNGIERAGEVTSIAHPKARYPYNISLSQYKIEDIFLDSLRSVGVTVDRPIVPTHLELSEDTTILKDPNAHAVKVTLESADDAADGQSSKAEVVHAKFVVGCDGAHSWVRKSLYIAMDGDQTEYIWGAVDMIPDTDFPDIRKISIIRSDYGSCMIIPRQNDMIRLYVQLSKSDMDTSDVLDKMGPEKLLKVARKSLHPYTMGNPKGGFDWWSVYTIGQRLASEFSVKDRVFIAGDACHTHSPKAGQGMNASINDAHNLTWKVAQVLRGWADISLLKTYAFERRQFAQDLIELDKIWSALASGKDATTTGLVPLQQLSNKHRGFVSGVGVRYLESVIVDVKHQTCCANLIIGERVPPQILICLADARPHELHDLLPADTRFKVLIFTGDVTADGTQRARVEKLAEEMGRPESFLKRFSCGTETNRVFDVLTICSGKKEVVDPVHLPVLFRSHWSKVFVDDLDTTGTQGGKVYKTFGIEPSGVVVIVRPDGYISAISPFDSINNMVQFFAAFMKP